MLAGPLVPLVVKRFSALFVERFRIVPLVFFLSTFGAPTAHAQSDNGIHVGKAKVYDSRELTLMLDNLSESLQGRQFIDPSQLAKVLGNVQGFRESDTSFAFQAIGAVGSGAASVFSGTPAASTTTPATDASGSTSPAATISVSLTLNAGSTTASTAATTSPSATTRPQPPALPALQTGPTYTPTFGSNGSDLLSDEVNLTYQLYNVRMLLDRSLTDRTIEKRPRLQAVVGFDIDIEPRQDCERRCSRRPGVGIHERSAFSGMPSWWGRNGRSYARRRIAQHRDIEPPKGYFRVIVFIVTDFPIIQAEDPETSDQAKGWPSGGATKPPPKISKAAAPTNISVTAFV